MPKVLIIEDEAPIRAIVRDWFEFLDYEVETYATATEGIQALVTTRPDAVLLDLMLPDMEGYSALAIIVAVRPSIPVLVCTAYARTDTEASLRNRAFLLGAKDFMTKPFDAVELIERVSGMIDEQHSTDQS